MPGFLDLPLELRNYVYEILLWEEVEPQFRGVMVVSEVYVKRALPMRCYRGLVQVCRQIRCEFKQAVQHMVAAKQLKYELTLTFSHGRPYFSLEWSRFPGLSPTINHLLVHVDLRTQEPFQARVLDHMVPHAHELAHLLEDSDESFAVQVFDYIAILLKTLANLLSSGDPGFNVLYAETMTLNLRTPTKASSRTSLVVHNYYTGNACRQVTVDRSEARKLHKTMSDTLKSTSRRFHAYNANDCSQLVPLIQVGALQFATEGQIWGKGNNLVLAETDFQWLRY